MPETLAGRLLVAGPSILDPNFARTVVLMIEHGPDGAVGVVLNRPSTADVLEHLPGWFDAAVHPKVVFIGGPVGDTGGIGLARGSGGVPMDGWSTVLGLRPIDLSEDPTDTHGLDVRIFAGYSGWGAGQLEAELSVGGWVITDAEADDVFTDRPDLLWSQVLKRTGGRNALLATYPDDVRLN